jgi:hypothetical protein
VADNRDERRMDDLARAPEACDRDARGSSRRA